MIQERLYCEMAGVCKSFVFNKTKLKNGLRVGFFFLGTYRWNKYFLHLKVKYLQSNTCSCPLPLILY